MAYYNPLKEESRINEEKAFIELKKILISKNEFGKKNELFPALEYIIRIEKENDLQKNKLKQYEEFFNLMSNLLPKQHSVFDVIN